MLNDVSTDVLSKTAINDINKKVESMTTDLKVLKNKIYESVSTFILKTKKKIGY